MKQSKSAIGLAGLCLFTISVVSVATIHLHKSKDAITPAVGIAGTYTLGAKTVNQGYVLQAEKNMIYPSDQSTQQYRYSATVDITNTSLDVLQVSPGLHLSLIGNDQKIYSVTADYLEIGTVIGGPMQPGATTSLVVDFKLPIGVEPKTLRFQPDTGVVGEVAL